VHPVLPIQNVLIALSCPGTKQNFFAFLKNETKTFKIAPGFLRDKTKLLVVSKNFGKQTRTKGFGPKFSRID
jgi:hypothetical protein